MADGRFVSKKIAHDFELNTQVSLEADYLFTRCIPHLDKEGRLPGHPVQVKAIAVPLRMEMTPEVVDRCLGELAAAGFILWYEVSGRPYVSFRNFDKNQKGLRKDREAESEVPSPHHPQLQRVTTVLRTGAGPTPEDSGPEPAEIGLSEVKVREVKGSTDAKASEAGASPDVDLLDLDPAEDADWKQLRLAYFEPLRKHIWDGKRPPPNVPSPGGKQWTEANELSIVRNWLRTGTLYADEVEPLMRELRLRMGWTGPASLSWVNTADAAPRLREILNDARKKMPPKATGLDLRGVLRAS